MARTHCETVQEIAKDPFPRNLAIALFRLSGISASEEEIVGLTGVLPEWLDGMREPRGLILRLRYEKILTYAEIVNVLNTAVGILYSASVVEHMKADAIYALQVKMRKNYGGRRNGDG